MKLQKLFLIVFVFAIFANTYTIESIGLGYGEVLLLVLFPFLFISSKRSQNEINNSTKNLYIVFLLYCFFVTLLNSALVGDITEAAKSMIRNLFYVSLYTILSRKYFDYSLAKKYYTIFSVALATFIIIQFFAFQIAGIYISGHIPGLSIDESMREEQALTAASYVGYIRPHGFLSEPANCAHALILSLILEIIPYQKEEVNKKYIALYVIALILTASTNAYVFLVTAFLLWLYNGRNVHYKYKNLVYSFTVIAIVAVVYFYFDKFAFAVDAIDKISSVSEGTNNSAGLRLMRGPAFFAEMPIISQMFGYGWGNFLSFRSYFHIWTVFEEEEEYMSSLFSYITSVGVIGTAIVGLCLYKAVHLKQFKNKAITIIFLITCISSSIAHSPIGALFIAFAIWSENHMIWKNK